MNHFNILGLNICACTPSELNRYILQACKNGEKRLILSGNVHSYNLALKHPWLKEFMSGADIIRCDGAGVVLGGRLLGFPMKKRITWADYAWDLGRFCQDNKLSLYFLGNKPGVAGQAGRVLRQKFPGLNIAGTFHGFFKKDGPENKAVINAINQSRPDILLVGFGMPLQEKWLKENYPMIQTHVVMTCGAAFEFVSGTTQRCPQWMGNAGLEWLFRFMLEPIRMFNRYIIGNIRFFLKILFVLGRRELTHHKQEQQT